MTKFRITHHLLQGCIVFATGLMPYALADGIGTGLAQGPDIDGDGVPELVIGISSSTSRRIEAQPSVGEGGGSGTTESPIDQELPSVGLLLLSPKNGKCLGVIHHGLRLSSARSPFTMIGPLKSGDSLLAYVGRELEENAGTFMVTAEISTGRELGRIRLPKMEWTFGGPDVWWLGGTAVGSEVLVSARLHPSVGSLNRYKAYRISLPKGEVLQTIIADLVGPVGDVDGDGYVDFVSSEGSIHSILSGKTGKAIVVASHFGGPDHFDPNLRHYAAGDCNGDGTGDLLQLLVSGQEEYARDRALRARVVSGRSGLPIVNLGLVHEHNSIEGSSMILQDQDGDGTRDILILYTDWSRLHEGWVVYSGRSGKLIKRQNYPPREKGSMFDIYGYSLLPITDVDGDHIGDGLISRVGWEVEKAPASMVQVVSFQTGEVLREYQEEISLGCK